MTTLRDLTDGLEEKVNAILGDEIAYTPAGGAAATFDAWVEFGSADINTSGSRSTQERIVIEVAFARLAVPSADDRVMIALRPGRLFGPAEWEPAQTGSAWRLILKRVQG